MVAIVKRPTHLQLTTAPRLSPVKTRYVHHPGENAPDLPAGDPVVGAASSFANRTQKYAVSAVKKINGESRRIKRD
jgi:hypothetical protein